MQLDKGIAVEATISSFRMISECEHLVFDLLYFRNGTQATMTHKISPSSIVAGLTTLDRSTLATFLAVFEDSRAVSLLSDKIGAFKDDAAGKYAAWKDRTTAETRERFSVRVQETATRIESSDVSDDALRICLWAHIRESFGLLPRIAVSPRDLKNAANDVGGQVGMAIARKRKVEEQASYSKRELAYYKKYNPFSDNSLQPVAFDDAVREIVLGLFRVAMEDNNTSEAQKAEILSILKAGLAGVDKSILKEAGVDSLTDDAVRKLLATSGGLLGLMGAVNVAGFSAYILAAQASAVIPLVGGKTLISALYVLSGPQFVLPALVATAVWTARNLTKNIRQAFAVTVSALLAIRGVETKNHDETKSAAFFFYSHHLIAETLTRSSLLRPPKAGIYKELGEYLTSGISFPSLPSTSLRTRKLLQTPLDTGEKSGLIESFLFPNTAKTDATILAGMVLGDFLFDLSAIDPKVLEAADFSHNADLSSSFDFAAFAEKISVLYVRIFQWSCADFVGGGLRARRLRNTALCRHNIRCPECS